MATSGPREPSAEHKYPRRRHVRDLPESVLRPKWIKNHEKNKAGNIQVFEHLRDRHLDLFWDSFGFLVDPRGLKKRKVGIAKTIVKPTKNQPFYVLGGSGESVEAIKRTIVFYMMSQIEFG